MGAPLRNTSNRQGTDEEKETDQKLTELAEFSRNVGAMHGEED